jgi:hypothetical protein
MEQKTRNKWWHHVVALLLGYVAAGITYTFIPIVLAYPTGMLRGATQSPFFSIEMLDGLAMFAGIIVWIFVYVSCIRSWRKPS